MNNRYSMRMEKSTVTQTRQNKNKNNDTNNNCVAVIGVNQSKCCGYNSDLLDAYLRTNRKIL